MRYTVTQVEHSARREFFCTACKHRALVELEVIGEGAETALNSAGTSRQRAQEDARAEVDRALGILACPSCGCRDEDGVAAWRNRHVHPLLALAAALLAFGWYPWLFDTLVRKSDRLLLGWVMTGITVISVAPFLYGAKLKWERIDERARFLPPDADGSPAKTPAKTSARAPDSPS